MNFKKYNIKFKAEAVSNWRMDLSKLSEVLNQALRDYAKENEAIVGQSTLYLNEDSNI